MIEAINVLEVELNGIGGGWEDITADLVGEAVCTWGLPGATPRDLVAPSGAFSFRLNNNSNNSQGVLGAYSLKNANKRPGWDLGIRCRFGITYGGQTKTCHIGWIRAANPGFGKREGAFVDCISLDWMDLAAVTPVVGVETQLEKRPDEIFPLLVACVETAPEATTITVDEDVYSFALDQLKDAKVLEAFQRLGQSSWARIYVKANKTGGGQLVYEERRQRLQGSVGATLDDNFHDGDITYEREKIWNKVRLVVSPRTLGEESVVLFSLADTSLFKAGETRTVSGAYGNPDRPEVRVGGTSVVGSYELWSGPNRSGVDLTGGLTVDVEALGSSSVFLRFINNSGSDGYLYASISGIPLYTYQPVTTERIDQTSIDSYRENLFSMDMPEQDDLIVAEAVADWILDTRGAEPVNNGLKVGFVLNASAVHMLAFRDNDISSLVVVSEDVSGVDNEQFWINAVELRTTGRHYHHVTWLLEKAHVNDPPGWFLIDTDSIDGPALIAPL